MATRYKVTKINKNVRVKIVSNKRPKQQPLASSSTAEGVVANDVSKWPRILSKPPFATSEGVPYMHVWSEQEIANRENIKIEMPCALPDTKEFIPFPNLHPPKRLRVGDIVVMCGEPYKAVVDYIYPNSRSIVVVEVGSRNVFSYTTVSMIAYRTKVETYEENRTVEQVKEREGYRFKSPFETCIKEDKAEKYRKRKPPIKEQFFKVRKPKIKIKIKPKIKIKIKPKIKPKVSSPQSKRQRFKIKASK